AVNDIADGPTHLQAEQHAHKGLLRWQRAYSIDQDYNGDHGGDNDKKLTVSLEDPKGGTVVIHVLEDKIVAKRRNGNDKIVLGNGLADQFLGPLVERN